MRRTTQNKQRLVTNKAPFFKLKSTTQHRTKLLRNKTSISARKDKHPILSIYKSTKATTKNEKHKFLFVRNQKNQTSIAKASSQNYHKTNIPNNTGLINTIKAGKKGRKNTITAENSTFMTTVSIKTSKPYQTIRKVGTTKMRTNTRSTLAGISNKMTSTKEIAPHIAVSSQKSALATTPTKSMKHDTEDSSKITITTINEYEYLKQLLSNFRRNAKADDVLPHTKKSTANISRTVLATAKIQTIDPLSKPNDLVSTIQTTTLKLTSPSHHVWNHTAVSTSTAVYFNTSTDKALELTKKSNFQPTNTTPMPSLHTSLKTTLRRPSVSVRTSSVSNNTETLKTTNKGTGPVRPDKTEESHKMNIHTTTTLFTTRNTNATLKSTATQSDSINWISTKSNIQSSYTLSSKATPNVTITKKGSSEVTAHTQATSQTYQEEIKITQEINKLSTTLTTNSIQPLKVVADLDNLTTTTSTQKDKKNYTQSVIPLAVTISTSSEK